MFSFLLLVTLFGVISFTPLTSHQYNDNIPLYYCSPAANDFVFFLISACTIKCFGPIILAFQFAEAVIQDKKNGSDILEKSRTCRKKRKKNAF